MTSRPPRDLGLTWKEAAHGVQTAVAHEMNLPDRRSATDPKHLRTGVNCAMSDHAGLAAVLIKKGLITEAEYLESIRLFMNEELARYQDAYPGITFR